MRVARYYCGKGHTTFSLLPDCLSARLAGSLDEVEGLMVTVEAQGLAATARGLRGEEVELPGAERWLRRRWVGVRAALVALVTASPGTLGSVAEVTALRKALGTQRVLVTLRGMAAERLPVLPCPLGFARRGQVRAQRGRPRQHETGRDPPR